jgi:anti-anti-sigma factor
MGAEYLFEDVLLVDLPPKEPQIADELKHINETASNKGGCDVIVDFSKAEILSSVSISNLMILRQMLGGLGHQLVLCSVSLRVKGVFAVTGLEASFDFTDDKFAALESIQLVKHATP